ncbi:DUF2357 domain-containing protein [Mesorhizobium sp. YM1C-6-2]|uniref:DUF2357 domain-containing protein n=1 Tax=Mesorhizobium sp. YM1C-6-2 TaxID=1827501 RepID=UPI000EF1DFE1|nr:DUF2357 domain-containing protein [Mesorhizobium sp. YM1C-6-2]RLP26825.1 DUF2357 domain-containing protein [Mesorhizobium sp. YM1C-6-2]
MLTRLAFQNDQGHPLTELRIVARESDVDAIRVLSASEALEYGEEQIQLLEGCTYHYEVNDAGFELEPISGIVQRFMVGAVDLDRGMITPGLYVGSLQLHLLRDGRRIGSARVEVRSRKLDFRSDYRRMLDDIASVSLDLLLSMFSPSSVDVDFDLAKDGEALQQQFFFLRSLIDCADFRAAIQQVLAQPHSRLVATHEERSASRPVSGGADIGRQIASRYPRERLASSHPLRASLPTIPRYIQSSAVVETLDTQENRFVLFVIEQFIETLTTISSTLLAKRKSAAHFVGREIDPLLRRMEEYRGHDFFRDISHLTELPLGSPVLQRKAGYRQVLEAWLKFTAAGRLTWGGLSDVISAGSRNAAALYEYWLFFVMLKALEPWLGAEREEVIKTILSPRSDGFGLKVKSGQVLPLPSVALTHKGCEWKLQFSYNRTFSDGPSTPNMKRLTFLDTGNSESWSRKMRPDFTVSFWPAAFDQNDAAMAGKLIHLHFDAKYSVDQLRDLFGDPEIDIDEEKDKQRVGRYTRGDLLKMHAYKDAIRRSMGAYVLYPGQGSGHRDFLWQEYHEVIPGLGAFSIRPDEADSGCETIQRFLLDILDEISTTTSH